MFAAVQPGGKVDGGCRCNKMTKASNMEIWTRPPRWRELLASVLSSGVKITNGRVSPTKHAWQADSPLLGRGRVNSETLGQAWQLTNCNVITLQTMCQEVGCDFHQGLCLPVFCIAVSVLWLALHKEKFPLLADTHQAAAGVAGKHKWALILPSSARVFLVTYTTVIAVRYPELDNSVDGLTCLGNYLLGTQSGHGGFLPVFWNAPTAYMHAATDMGCVVDGFAANSN